MIDTDGSGAAGRGDERIVVGFDGSPAAWTALRWAADEAGRRRDVLDVVSCVHEPSTYPETDARDGACDTARMVATRQVDEAARVARERGCQIPVHTVVATGTPADVLVDLAHDAGMLVLGRHDLSAAAAAAAPGSTAADRESLSDFCDAHTPCRVTVVATPLDPDHEQPRGPSSR